MPRRVKRPNWPQEFMIVVIIATVVAGLVTVAAHLLFPKILWWGDLLVFITAFLIFVVPMLYQFVNTYLGYHDSLNDGLIEEEPTPNKTSRH